MRKYIILKRPVDNIFKLMIYSTFEGVYLFLFDSIFDKPCINDMCFDNLLEAESYCIDEYNISNNDWVFISDPFEDCQDDIIDPVRIKGRNLNTPEFGKFEKLINNQWIEIEFDI